MMLLVKYNFELFLICTALQKVAFIIVNVGGV